MKALKHPGWVMGLDWTHGMRVAFVGFPKDCTDAGAPGSKLPFVVFDVYTVEEVLLAPKGTKLTGGDGVTGVTKEDLVYIKILGRLAMAEGFRPVPGDKKEPEIITRTTQ